MSRQRHVISPGIYRETTTAGVVSYVARWQDTHGRTKSKSFPRLADARAHRAKAIATRDVTPGVTPGTFRALAHQYVQLHPHWRDSTKNTTQSRLRPILDAFGDVPAAKITTSDVRVHLSDLTAAGKSPRTVEAVRALIRAVFQVAVDDGDLGRNPVAPVKAIRDPRTSEDLDARLTDEQIDALEQHMPSDEWRGLLRFLLATGMRGSEAAGVTWDRVDLLHQRIRVDRQLLTGNYGSPVFGPPKSKASLRWVPMREGVREVLQAQREAHPVTVDGLVWVTATGAPMVRSARSEAWRAAAGGLTLPAGVRGWHALRHTCGSRLLDSGAPVTAIAAMLGHRPSELLGTYAHAEVDYAEALRSVPVSIPARKNA